MNVEKLISNKLVLDRDGVWVLNGHQKFSYSDGSASEKYLRKVLVDASDLSSTSAELVSYIKDWPSEYHLSIKRAQLLSGFDFDRSSLVLEVGCGCGAISRYLGEQFDQVISIEGSITRARLARLRTRDLDNVSIVCGPFQDVAFRQKFDIIFCIGVFEYSGSFISGEDPYDEALRYFKEMLTPNGTLVIAIENQFGLKYFSCSREDHIGEMFEGIEGYHRRPQNVRTFGKGELQDRLGKYFNDLDFYYPYPDYKIPDCVLSSSFVASGRAGELISQLKSRDYTGPMHRYWDEEATTLELARNGVLEFFANSFIAVAGNSDFKAVRFPQHGVFYSSGRVPRFSTRTRVHGVITGELKVTKAPRYDCHMQEPEILQIRPHEVSWVDSRSLQTQVLLLARMRSRPLAEIFEPCKVWLSWLMAQTSDHDRGVMLSGEHIDSVWGNAYISAGKCQIIDREFIWREPLKLQVVVIRAIYNLLVKLDDNLTVADALKVRSGRTLITEIAKSIGIVLSFEDFESFMDVEAELQFQVFGAGIKRSKFYLRWYLADRSSFNAILRLKKRIFHIAADIVSPRLSKYLFGLWKVGD